MVVITAAVGRIFPPWSRDRLSYANGQSWVPIPAPEPALAFRAALVVVGAGRYFLFMRIVLRELVPFVGNGRRVRSLLRARVLGPGLHFAPR
jgi:hypothetical protein